MTTDQIILFSLITLIFVFLLWGRVRYDVTAFAALVLAFLTGVIPKEQVFSGFGHPAVIIIALVLIVSRGLFRSGAIELLARQVVKSTRSLSAHIGIMAVVSAALSSIMNNVAALALLMPLDMQAAKRAKRSPALTLMPLSFASILGGMVTLIGTPPNIVIATFRESALGEPYGMFDFAPVGAVVAIVGVLFVTLIGWRLIPVERSKHDTAQELGDLQNYISNAKVSEASKAVGKALKDLDSFADESDVNILGLVRRGNRLSGTARRQIMRKNDLVVLEGRPDAIDQFVGAADLEHVGAEKHDGITAEAVALVEVVVPEGAMIVGRTAMEVRLLYRRSVTLLGISRTGKRIRNQVRKVPIKAGDLLLLLGPEEQLTDVVDWLGCLPLAERGLEVIQRSKAWAAVAIFTSAIIAASLGWIYLPLALAAVVVAYVILRIVPLSQVYDSVEWPVIVLLGSMIPIGAALETSGGTTLVANAIVDWTTGLPTVAVLAILMLVTMTLSDVLNNVATALIAAPIAVDIATRLDANPDAFLMAVAVAASCAFLTPIGHKNNTIIMGPGGYKFGDYWRMGLPLEILVVLVGIPMILFVWPL
ncbi:MAG: SLC13 family permease [Gammaproteobacteria bacterium]|nr:MAG: SLC13 family permease [Gammaproteobacteria bacterium]